MNLIIKGFIIGIGKIIPGVSGTMLAITLGIYEQLIENISNLKKNFMQSAKYLIKPLIGIILAIVSMSKIIVKCMNNYYFSTMLLFIGMIVGGLPNQIKKASFKKKDIITSLILLTSLILILSTNSNNNIIDHKIQYSIVEFVKLLGIGIIDAASSIIPGISGTAILMMLGYYNIILQTFSTVLDPNKISITFFIMIPFLTGFIIGILIISKIINIIIKRKQNIANIAIIIFTIITIFLLIKNVFSIENKNGQIIPGILLFILGIIISSKLDKITK